MTDKQKVYKYELRCPTKVIRWVRTIEGKNEQKEILCYKLLFKYNYPVAEISVKCPNCKQIVEI